ncbi:hypothetical protein CHARACLAT_001490 [Characodon lateralis]|uniref:Uncharacterized protein n=1 Tax=Characodon lateralis TaxID=208331 RepID=A0ABU7DMF2_9TELE|nr:hypothetical protein [Characodon lateralis]
MWFLADFFHTKGTLLGDCNEIIKTLHWYPVKQGMHVDQSVMLLSSIYDFCERNAEGLSRLLLHHFLDGHFYWSYPEFSCLKKGIFLPVAFHSAPTFIGPGGWFCLFSWPCLGFCLLKGKDVALK